MGITAFFVEFIFIFLARSELSVNVRLYEGTKPYVDYCKSMFCLITKESSLQGKISVEANLSELISAKLIKLKPFRNI